MSKNFVGPIITIFELTRFYYQASDIALEHFKTMSSSPMFVFKFRFPVKMDHLDILRVTPDQKIWKNFKIGLQVEPGAYLKIWKFENQIKIAQMRKISQLPGPVFMKNVKKCEILL